MPGDRGLPRIRGSGQGALPGQGGSDHPHDQGGGPVPHGPGGGEKGAGRGHGLLRRQRGVRHGGPHLPAAGGGGGAGGGGDPRPHRRLQRRGPAGRAPDPRLCRGEPQRPADRLGDH